MQPLKFAGLDVGAVTFAGLSVPIARRIAAWSSVALLFVAVAAMVALAMAPTASLETLVMGVVSLILMLYIFTGRFIIKDLAVFFAENTPVSVLYRADKRVLDKARAELLHLAEQVDFRHYYGYRKINPAIGCRRHLLVMAHQRKGDLPAWSAKSRNLKALADLCYQLHLAEKVIEADLKLSNP